LRALDFSIGSRMMAMGKRKPRQESLFIVADRLTPPAEPFYQRLPNTDAGDPVNPDRPAGWWLRDLISLATERTSIVAISHVQFTSGYTVDLKKLGDFCIERGMELVVVEARSWE